MVEGEGRATGSLPRLNRPLPERLNWPRVNRVPYGEGIALPEGTGDRLRYYHPVDHLRAERGGQ